MVTDPYDPATGLIMPKVQADIIIISHSHHDHNYVEAIAGTEGHPEPFIITGPGEYEVSQVFILGMPTFHDSVKGEKRGKNTIYLILADGLRICHLGDLGHLLTDKQLEELGDIDVLFIPVGGKYTLGPQKATEVINQVEPKIVIPMHYQVPSLKMDLAPVEKFINELGLEIKQPVNKLSLKAGYLPEEREIVVMESKI